MNAIGFALVGENVATSSIRTLEKNIVTNKVDDRLEMSSEDDIDEVLEMEEPISWKNQHFQMF